MSKKGKRDVLGASPHIENSQESGGGATAGKSAIVPPPAEYQFKPGVSGNPKGRPPTSDLKAEVRAFADEADPKVRKTRLRVWLEMADRRARQGSPKHLEMLLAYGWGRPSQALEVETGVNFTEALTSMRAKRALEEADQTIRQYLPTIAPGIATATSANGHSDQQTTQAAAAMPEDDAEQRRPADTPRPAMRVRVEL